MDWVIMSIPPTMTAVRTPMVAPSPSICWAIWYANSLLKGKKPEVRNKGVRNQAHPNERRYKRSGSAKVRTE